MSSRITFWTIARAFEGEFDALQRRAIASWREAVPEAEIVLVGNEPGVAAFAREIGATHVMDVTCNDRGTPLVNDAFARAERAASCDLLCWINSDIVLDESFAGMLKALDITAGPFVVGQRIDVDRKGNETLHPPCGIDYFVYRKDTLGEVPPFAVGCTAYDNWLVWAAIERWSLETIDATLVVRALHLAHGYPKWEDGKLGMIAGDEKMENQRLFRESGCSRYYGVNDTQFVMQADGRIVRRGKNRVLVTGGRGWIGAAACEELAREGYEVVPYDLKDDRDIFDSAALYGLLVDGYEAVVHLAAIPHPKAGLRWESYWETNVAGTQAVANVAAAARIGRFVYSSSTAYYGAQKGFPLGTGGLPLLETGKNGIQRCLVADSAPEMTPYNEAALGYVCSKIAAEAALAAYALARRLEVFVLRFAPVTHSGEPWAWDLLCDRDRAAKAVATAVKAPGDGRCLRIYNVANPDVEIVDTTRFENLSREANHAETEEE
jgi:hypothetical protein